MKLELSGLAFSIPASDRGHVQPEVEDVCDSQTGIPRAYALGARCVQRLDDSQIHANRINFRISLRSSSLQEPRDPLLKVVLYDKKKVKQKRVNILALRPGL